MTPTTQPAAIDFNAEFRRALSLMEETDKNVLVTGRAGTGKSTLRSYFRTQTKKQAVVLAPTGVAAVSSRVRAPWMPPGGTVIIRTRGLSRAL